MIPHKVRNEEQYVTKQSRFLVGRVYARFFPNFLIYKKNLVLAENTVYEWKIVNFTIFHYFYTFFLRREEYELGRTVTEKVMMLSFTNIKTKNIKYNFILFQKKDMSLLY